MDVMAQELLEGLTRACPQGTITHARTVPGRPARHVEWPQWTDEALRTTLIDASITLPFSHQAECAQLAWDGRDVVVATGTSSGKSLGYQLPVLTTLAEDPTACAIYLRRRRRWDPIS